MGFHKHTEPPADVVLAAFAVATGVLTISSVITHHWWPLARAGIGVATLLGFYLAIRLIDPIAIGYGDVLLAGLIGGLLAYASWAALIVGAFLGYLLGDAGVVAIMRVRRLPHRAGIPFSPFIAGGAFLALVVADPVTHAYLRLVHSS
jgi:leader peptidase (prepilin peptidase)/N-methyltransferase